MKFISIQNHKIPALGLGTYSINGMECTDAVSNALGQGYRHIDTAQMYGNEAEVGAGIKASPTEREDVFLTTKVLTENFNKRDFMPSVEDSLRKLKLDYVDLLLLHWPGTDEANKLALDLLNTCIDKGYTRMVGVSNFTTRQLQYARNHAPVICNQVEYHPYLSQQKILDDLRAHDMFLTAYRPLVKGAIAEDKTIQQLAEKYRRTAGQIVLRWLVQQPNVAAIPKAASAKNRADNLNIFDFELAKEDMQTIFNLNKNQRFVNPGWAPEWDK
ncbi:MAG: aldo/keto reductase [Sphingobacteriales bacterium JAD_PAG50586_3]|nr:MAG: aldo/keto reductase [Sphingobacteriales bacterium JAD_PAG50586_3]